MRGTGPSEDKLITASSQTPRAASPTARRIIALGSSAPQMVKLRCVATSKHLQFAVSHSWRCWRTEAPSGLREVRHFAGVPTSGAASHLPGFFRFAADTAFTSARSLRWALPFVYIKSSGSSHQETSNFRQSYTDISYISVHSTYYITVHNLYVFIEIT